MEIRLAGLEPESIVDGPGYRFTVFVQGCPHNCPGCHNPQTHDFGGGHVAQTDDVIAHLGQNPLVRGLTLSGGEPMMQPEPLYLIAKAAKEKGMNVKVVKASMMMSGRYVAENRTGDGFCKIVYDLDRRCVAGVQIVGSYASEMIYGAAMMVYSKSPVQHLDKIVFPHPSVCETIREALFMI